MKERLDYLLVTQGLAPSREKAKALIVSGQVYVDGNRVCKAGSAFEPGEVRIEVRGEVLPFVSRGGWKLEKACKRWNISLEGLVCMDIGASTGGFTDCMLQHGAKKVYAVDVGYGQLAEKLLADPRVVNMEKTNFRYLTGKDVEEIPDFAGVDVSFISLTKILLPARNLLKDGAQMVCLIKPQFEAGRDKVGKKGVVKSPAIHREVLAKVTDFASLVGFEILHLDFSPIKGPEGNIEYLLHLQKKGTGEASGADGFRARTESREEALVRDRAARAQGMEDMRRWQTRIWQTVESAHQELDEKAR